MVELQSCSVSLVNTSALRGIEQEVKGESTSVNNNNSNVIAQISAELQREREKNAELVERISILEAQIQERHGSCVTAAERSLNKKFKRQKTGIHQNGTEDRNVINGEISSQMKHDIRYTPPRDPKVKDRLVNWISMEYTQFSQIDKLKDDDFTGECDDSDDSDEEEDSEEADNNVEHENIETHTNADQIEAYLHQHTVKWGNNMPSMENFFCKESETNVQNQNHCMPPDAEPAHNKSDLQKYDKNEAKSNGGLKTSAVDHASRKEIYNTGPGSMSYARKPLKVAFCPKEVKRIVESESLLLKNAQSHTIRKIIVFASLGIRHGCDDMYELDFNHFSIFRKGEPYVSPNDPGEHVLYENPGVRRKIFYPNHQNPSLCPVQILEEEMAMRPSDPSCPSCLFLCIKYGGRTRNLPQNEYVRQRMGRNKLKSFGPVMCQMAMLVHVRSGSFFFKALGITLLFMAGFPDELVRRETKYRNLDLLQKYYRTDEDAEGDELFLPHRMTSDTQASQGSEKLTGKTTNTKSKGKKQASSITKPCDLPRSSIHQIQPLSSASPTQFGLAGYSSIQTPAMATFLSMPFLTVPDTPPVPKHTINTSGTNVPCQHQTPYHMFPPLPANPFMPMMYWSPPNAFPPRPYASTYDIKSFPSTTNCFSLYPQHYYSHLSCSSLIPKVAERSEKNDSTLKEADSDSDSSSSSTEPK